MDHTMTSANGEGRREEVTGTCGTSEEQGISVIIPTRDRPVELIQVVEALSQQYRCTTRLELIIVNDGGEGDQFEATCRDCQRRFPLIIRYFHNVGVGAADARNLGAMKARNGVLAFLDDDSIPREDWIEAIVKAFFARGQGSVQAITGSILPVNTDCPFSLSRQLRYDMRQAAAAKNRQGIDFLAGGNCAMRQELWDKLGGFDRNFVLMHDREFAMRARARGVQIGYVPDMSIRHHHYKGLRTLLKACWRSGAYRLMLQHRFPGRRDSESRRWLYWRIYRFGKQRKVPLVAICIACCCDAIHAAGYLVARIRRAAVAGKWPAQPSRPFCSRDDLERSSGR